MTKTVQLCRSIDQALEGKDGFQSNWIKAQNFEARAGQLVAVPDLNGEIDGYIFGLGNEGEELALQAGAAAAKLPKGEYELAGDAKNIARHQLAFGLGTYRFNATKTSEPEVTLGGTGEISEEVLALTQAAFLARDLINMPANLLGPNAFAHRIHAFAEKHQMEAHEILGQALVEQNFPLVHTVGRASAEAPRLLDLRWGREDHPRVTLVGKGVTFDTGGLDIKPAAGMSLMKKDMGGAANILGLAEIIMRQKLPVRLRVLIPIVENAISGSAFRPGDVLQSRKGLSVEIGNTDAEGRLILADALAYAAEEEPELLLDMATLTGAARVALGFDVPSLFTQNLKLAAAMQKHGAAWGDDVWHMPLHRPYAKHLASRVADVNHIASMPYAGATMAALFLEKFVGGAKDWVHLDISGWSLDAKPGRPVGGADQGMRAAYFTILDRFGS